MDADVSLTVGFYAEGKEIYRRKTVVKKKR
jgi:hypothetical protein